METMHKKVTATVNKYRMKLLRAVYFENSLFWKIVGLAWYKAMKPTQRVEALTLIREKNNKVKL
jgi:hypothetical protein